MAKKKKRKPQRPQQRPVEMITLNPIDTPKTKRGASFWLKIAGIAVLAAAIIAGGSLKVFVNGTAGADEESLAAATRNLADTGMQDALVFGDASAECALVLYPADRTDFRAYSLLARSISERGVLCIVPELTLSMTALSADKADAYIGKYGEVKHWFIGGLSKGGETAIDYAVGHTDKVEGIVLLSAYSETDLANTGLRVLSIYGSEDAILQLAKYNDRKKNLPEGFTELVIAGGNHSHFANYGDEGKDGEATISRTEQQAQTADAIASFVR